MIQEKLSDEIKDGEEEQGFEEFEYDGFHNELRVFLREFPSPCRLGRGGGTQDDALIRDIFFIQNRREEIHFDGHFQKPPQPAQGAVTGVVIQEIFG